MCLLSRFTPEDYIKCLLEYKPTTLFVVPSLLTFLATHPLVKKEYIQSVETIMIGAAPITDSMLEKFLLKCEKTKDEIKLLQGLFLYFIAIKGIKTCMNKVNEKL